MICCQISEIDHGRRVDSFLFNLLPMATLPYLRKLISSGHFLRNGSPVTPGTLLRAKDAITLKESSKTVSFRRQPPPPLDLLYEDSWVMAFNKPAAIAMHRTAEVEEDDLVEAGTRFFTRRGGEGKLRPVNRLDKGTSGVVLLAKSASAAGMFGRFIMETGLDKLYLAVVAGRPSPEGRIAIPLDGKEAETSYRLLAQSPKESILALHPISGRMHQLRQHLSLIGHPIVGDRRYGGPASPQIGHALHSFTTRFHHPDSGEHIVIVAPPPKGFLELVAGITGAPTTPATENWVDISLE